MDAQLLLVEDDDAIASLLERALTRDGYAVRRVSLGADALPVARSWRPDLVILDLGLPDVDGVDVCRDLRAAGVTSPILMLSARGSELDRVVGLDVGADDYLSKPFGLAELQARIRALLRRATAPSAPSVAAGTVVDTTVPGAREVVPAATDARLRLDVGARTARVGAQDIEFTAKEFDLVARLARDPGIVVTREQLMDDVWDENWFGSTKTLDVTIARARAKLVAAASTTRISTARGVGFRLEEAT